MCKEKNHGHHSIEEIAKQHNMTVEEFTKKSGLKFNEDGSHSMEGHTLEMFSKKYTPPTTTTKTPILIADPKKLASSQKIVKTTNPITIAVIIPPTDFFV